MRPPLRALDSGTSVQTRIIAISPSPAAPQNSRCQLAFWAIAAAAGSPRAPPTPSEELISPIAEPSRSGASSSRIRLMPSGITPAAQPCSARPTIIGTSEELSAPTTDPATSSPRQISSIRRLPNMSPSRPVTGVATAPASRVAVSTHVTDAASVRR